MVPAAAAVDTKANESVRKAIIAVVNTLFYVASYSSYSLFSINSQNSRKRYVLQSAYTVCGGIYGRAN